MSDITKHIEETKQAIAEIRQAMAKHKEAGTKIDEAAVEAMINKRLDEQKASAPKGGFIDDEPVRNDPSGVLMQKSNDSKILDFQKWNDDCVLLSQVLRRPVQNLKYFQKSKEVNKGLTELSKAMAAANAAQGADWIPTDFSSDLHYKVYLDLKVASLLPNFTMPSNPYKMPIVLSDAQSYLNSENTTSSPTKFTESTPGTAAVTFTASKLVTRVLFSEELTEDSVTPVLPFLKNSIAHAIATGVEDALLNGDNAVTHMDSDVTSGTDPRKAWDGLRRLTSATNDTSLSTFNTAGLRSQRGKMGKYGVDPNKLAWLVSTKVYMLMLGLTEVLTMEKYGPNATILTGELGRLDNIPIIVSEKMRDDLNASGVNDSTTNAKGITLLVYRDAFMLGNRRQVTTRSFFDVQTDQTALVNSWRGDFQPIFSPTADVTVCKGVNVTV